MPRGNTKSYSSGISMIPSVIPLAVGHYHGGSILAFGMTSSAVRGRRLRSSAKIMLFVVRSGTAAVRSHPCSLNDEQLMNVLVDEHSATHGRVCVPCVTVVGVSAWKLNECIIVRNL